MSNKKIRRMILQTLFRGKIVHIKDSPNKEHLLGKGYCENIVLIDNYIKQLNKNNIVSVFQKDEYSDLFIETKQRLEIIWR